MARSTWLWLARDTFRQARATRLSRLILAASGLCILLCLSVRIEGEHDLRPEGEIELVGADDLPLVSPEQRPGRLTLGFGALRIGLFRGGDDAVHFLQVILAKWVAGAAGTLLALVWASGFLPEFLQPGAVSVLLAKPVPRRQLLIGKYLGTIAFVAVQAGVFVLGTWLALGAGTGCWAPGYLVCLPLLVAHFSVIYSASTLLAVCTRNASVCAFGSIVFWCLCFAMNRGRHLAVAASASASASASALPSFRGGVEAGYWFLPKPADFVILLDQAMRADAHFRTLPEIDMVREVGAFHPGWSMLASAAFAVALLVIAAREFDSLDY
jgi:hypothetical protein